MIKQIESDDNKKILYLGWLGQNNIGDDVLFELFLKTFDKYNCLSEKVYIDALSTATNNKVNISSYDLTYYLNICSEAIKLNIPVVSWGTGIDGFYKKDQLNSIALSTELTNHYKEVYERFKYISVRGPFTKNAMLNVGVINQIDEIGDPALIYADETFGKQHNTNKNDNKNILT
jgi:hypothetical protein